MKSIHTTVLLLSLIIPTHSFSVEKVQNVAGKIIGSVVAPAVLATTPMATTAIEPLNDASSITSTNKPLLSRQQQTDTTNTEGYLPRKLYPGTYANYCGPTPEVRVKNNCAARGWHGDDPIDKVDAACRLHDVSYCNCETQLLSRKNAAATTTNKESEEDDGIPMLSSMVALRFMTKSAIEKTVHADAEYFDCVNKADRRLIADGVRIRAQEQRNGCSTDPSLAWFCDLRDKKGTLATFERVNLSIFLKDLEADGVGANGGGMIRLSKLEQKRYEGIQREIRGGKSVAEAASSRDVEEEEEQMLRILAVEDIDGVAGMP